jgi:glycosyltransferase involved in cell wall biosynthesis
MKLLVATPLYPPDSGGPATDSAMLYAELPKFDIQVVVCSFGTVRHLPVGIRHLCYGWELLKTSRSVHSVDVIVSMDTFSVCLPALLVSWILRVPLVIRVPGDYAWEQASQRFGVTDSIKIFQGKHYGWKVEILRKIQKFAVRRAALVVTISDFFKSIVAQWGIPSGRLIRIYLGLDPALEVTKPENVPEGKILFSLGRFVPWKGFAMLIELLPELPDEWKLVLAGDGPLRALLEEKSVNIGVSDRVIFTGVVPHAEALGWYRAADAFVLNTSFESFSFQVLEALGSGTPVITTTAGSIPELVTNAVDGVLCEPNDKESFKQAILSTQTDRSFWKECTENAARKAATFSAKRSMQEFASVLKKLCA